MQAKRWHKDVVLALGLVCLPAIAAVPGERRLTLGGFGTLGAIYHDEDDREYRRSTNQSSGAEAGKLDFLTDSLVGVQLNAAWSQHVEFVAQAVSRRDSESNWKPRLTRTFVRWAPQPSLMLRLGRIGSEMLPRADSRDIGYSYLPIRPPPEVFGLLPHDDLDGADVTFTYPLGGGLARAKLYGGQTGGKLNFANGPQVDVDGSGLWGGHIEYLQGNWAFRLGSGVFMTDDEPAVDQLVAALRQAGTPESQALADELGAKDRRTVFTVLGAAYDDSPWQLRLFLVQAENDHAPGPKLRFGTFLAGYTFDQWTPYALFSAVDSYAEIRGTGLPDTPQTAALNAAARNAQLLQQPQQHSISLGLRYDIAPKIDLKLQVDQIKLRGSSLVLDQHMPPQEQGDMTVFGVAVDFIF